MEYDGYDDMSLDSSTSDIYNDSIEDIILSGKLDNSSLFNWADNDRIN